MSDTSLPQIGKPYSTQDGFAMWRPHFTSLVVAHYGNGLMDLIVKSGDTPAISFSLDAEQRADLASRLLAQEPIKTAQPATENVAQGV